MYEDIVDDDTLFVLGVMEGKIKELIHGERTDGFEYQFKAQAPNGDWWSCITRSFAAKVLRGTQHDGIPF